VLFIVAGRPAVDSGRPGRVPDAGAATATSATVGGIGDRLDNQGRGQVLDLVAGKRDQPRRWWVSGVFGQGHYHQEGMGEHGEGDPAVPGAPAAVPRQLAGFGVAADHQPVRARLATRSRLAILVQTQERPLVQAVALGAGAAGDLLPPWRQVGQQPPAQTPWRAVAAPLDRTGPRSGPATHSVLAAIGQALCCGLPPPSDLRLCSQHRIINAPLAHQPGHDLRLEY
jgi:hypothetical protein